MRYFIWAIVSWAFIVFAAGCTVLPENSLSSNSSSAGSSSSMAASSQGLRFIINQNGSTNTNVSITDFNPGAGYALSWQDDFSNMTLNTSSWNIEVLPAGTYNGEWEAYTSSSKNVFITNVFMMNCLAIQAIYNGNGIAQGNYTSGRINTSNKVSFLYGVIAAKIKMPEGQGYWPTFWLLGNNDKTVGWPKCGEIDVVEESDNGTNVLGHIHGPGSSGDFYGGAGIGVSHAAGYDTANSFHVYSVNHSTNSIIFALDGTNYYTVTSNNVIADGFTSGWVFNQSFFCTLNVAIGGNLPGNPTSSTIFPQCMYVQWVRFYTN